MDRIAATDAKHRFGELLDHVQREPVAITKQGRPVALMVGVEDAAVLEVVEDAFWARRAIAAEREGYLGEEAGAALLEKLMNAKA